MDKVFHKLDECDFVKLYVRYEAHIRGFILCMVPYWVDVDDIMQETVTVLWTKYQDKITQEEQFLKLAYRVARFEVYHYIRRRPNQHSSFSPELLESLSAKAILASKRDDYRQVALQSCMQELKPRDRELLRLRYELGANTRTVAERLGRNLDAVYKALNRVHDKLMFCIQHKLAQE